MKKILIALCFLCLLNCKPTFNKVNAINTAYNNNTEYFKFLNKTSVNKNKVFFISQKANFNNYTNYGNELLTNTALTVYGYVYKKEGDYFLAKYSPISTCQNYTLPPNLPDDSSLVYEKIDANDLIWNKYNLKNTLGEPLTINEGDKVVLLTYSYALGKLAVKRFKSYLNNDLKNNSNLGYAVLSVDKLDE